MTTGNGKLPRMRWKILNPDPNRSIIDVILQNRNLPPSHMDAFKLTDRLHAPELLPDLDKAVQRILRAVENEEKITVFGDYDVDGITSTALMIYFFRKINYSVTFMLPHREKDGYGLRPAMVNHMAEEGTKLIITVDNGTTSHEAIEHAAKLGIDVVVTDHHLPEGNLPAALAVVNPNRKDSEYPFKTICGVAVAFKLIFALSPHFMAEDDYKQFLLNHLDLVAMGTIADVMPLRDENYALVKFGLKVLSGTRKPGLIELKKISGVREGRVTPISVGYFLAPRLNASGRLDMADISVKLLISESPAEAKNLADRLNRLNQQRQKMQSDYVADALAMLDDSKPLEKVIFVENDHWHAGLIGLVSGKLKERFSRPVLAFTRDDNGNFVGSARSIDAFHVTNALSRFNHYFVNYGGHHKAAGLTIPVDKYPSFKKEFLEYARSVIHDEDLIQELIVDSVVDINQINLSVARIIQDVGPFGETNPEPVFVMQGVRIHEIRELSGGKHLKLFVEKGNQMYECLWWNAGEYKDSIAFRQKVDVAFRLNINNWQGTDRLQFTLEDIRTAKQ